MEGLENKATDADAALTGGAAEAIVQCSPRESSAGDTGLSQSENHTDEGKNEKQNEEVYDSCVTEVQPAVGATGDGSAVDKPVGAAGAGEVEGGVPKEKKPRRKETKQRRSKGTGGLQQEKTGMWTVRALINGKRVSKSTGTKDKGEAERFLKKFLAPYVKDDAERTFENIKVAVAGERERARLEEEKLPQMKISEVWDAYERSPMRRDLAPTTLKGKKQIWKSFVDFLDQFHKEVIELRHVQRHHCEEYLNILRHGHSSLTYNGRLCVLREMTRVLARDALVTENPWEGFQMRADDSHTRREFTIEELARIIDVAGREGFEWRCLFAIGMYTGMRLGDCCKLTWGECDVVRSLIQKIPEKTKKYRKGRPVAIPIHGALADLLVQIPIERRTGYVLPQIGQWASEGTAGMGKIHHRLGKIFHNAGIVTSVMLEGRQWKSPDAGFHSLRHTFVSLSANAGVPLHIVQSIVGHESTAMTRHYFHESLPALQKAVEALPTISETGEVSEGTVAPPDINRMYNRMPAQQVQRVLPPPPPLVLPQPQYAPEAPTVVSADGVKRPNPAAEAPLVGRSAVKNAARREEKLMAVEAASADAAQMGGWGLPDEKGAHLPTINRRQRQEWVSRCVRKWCASGKIALTEGMTKLIGNGGYKFLQDLWDKGTPMLPDDAIDALEVFLRAKGVRGEVKSYLK